MTTNKEAGVYDDVKAALEESMEKEESTAVVDEQPLSESQSTRERDESGRFKPKKAVEETAPVAEVIEEKDVSPQQLGAEDTKQTEGQWNQDKAPSSWAPKFRERWAEIPLELRQQIVQREEAAVRGVKQLHDKFAPAESFLQALGPYIQEAQQNNVSPEVHISSVLQSERVLRTADLPTKFNEILRIADQFGVPLRDVINKSVGSEVLKTVVPANSVPPELQRDLQEMKQWRRQIEINNAANMVEAFGQDKEFFSDVRDVMSSLLTSGEVNTLQEAYDEAVWRVPGVREVLIARQQGKAQKDSISSRQLAASKASVPTTGKVDVVVEKDDDDIASVIRKELHRAASGRV